MTGLLDWWEKGKLPNEHKIPWKDLIKDDLSKITKTDEAFRRYGQQGMKGWRPHRAFTPQMLKTAPTPLVRQVVGRGSLPVGVGLLSYDLTDSLIDTEFADKYGFGREDFEDYGEWLYHYLND